MIWAWVLLAFVGLVSSRRGKPIDIYQQTGGDIKQLRRFNRTGLKYNAIPFNADCRWSLYPDGLGNYLVPYVISGHFDCYERDKISVAMRVITSNTCIRFTRKRHELFYIDFQNQKGHGCYTTVGRHLNQNIIMLEANDDSTCVMHDIILHELMHTLGLWHEHMRNDRDNYIKIHYENINKAYYSQFKKVSSYESTTYGVDYDYTSVMHYKKNAFGVSSTALTMETLNPKYQDVIGNVKSASPGDFLKICSIYNCSICMGKPFSSKTVLDYQKWLKKQMFNNHFFAPKSIISRNESEASDYVTSLSNMAILSNSTEPNTTRATRLITTVDPLFKTDDLGESDSTRKGGIDCNNRFYCPIILKSWNKNFMCQLQLFQKWCCLTCTGNNH